MLTTEAPEHANLMAIGGGDINSNRPLIEEALAMTGSEHPNVLLVPSAKSTERSFATLVAKYDQFFDDLGASYELLHPYLMGDVPTPGRDELEYRLGSADLIHIAGGNLPALRQTWEQLHLESLMDNVMRSGKVVSGTSAGAVVMFARGLSNPHQHGSNKEQVSDYVLVDGLGVIDGLVCPHYHDRNEAGIQPRREALLGRAAAGDLVGEPETVLGIDSNAALVARDGLWSVITAVDSASVFEIVRQNGQTTEADLRT